MRSIAGGRGWNTQRWRACRLESSVDALEEAVGSCEEETTNVGAGS